MLKKLLGSSCGVTLAAGLVLGGLSACASPQVNCGYVPLTSPGSLEHGAWQVTTYGTACSTAKALILAQQNGIAASFPLYGYRCVSFPVVPMGLAYQQFVCTGLHGRAVTWHYNY